MRRGDVSPDPVSSAVHFQTPLRLSLLNNECPTVPFGEAGELCSGGRAFCLLLEFTRAACGKVCQRIRSPVFQVLRPIARAIWRSGNRR